MQRIEHRLSYIWRTLIGKVNYLLRKWVNILRCHKSLNKYKLHATKFKKDNEADKKQEENYIE